MDTLLDTSVEMDMQEKTLASVLELQKFLSGWDYQYQQKANQIDLFNQQLVSNWNSEQQQLFTKLLYHQRAHFDDILWFMGNFAPNREAKQIILNNTKDEYGMDGLSHERLYLEFAKMFGVDLTYELIDEKYYFPFLREYNYGHLKWLRDHDWNHRLAAFSAIERLDNLDYLNLRNVAVSMGANGKALTFFNVHIHVKHFEEAEPIFANLWHSEANIIREVFKFIGDYQIDIWRKISDAIFKKNYL